MITTKNTKRPALLVIKYRETMQLPTSFFPASSAVWAKVTPRSRKTIATPAAEVKTITREEALDLIRERGLVRVEHSRDGSIYDTPDCAFQRRYKGRIFIPQIV